MIVIFLCVILLVIKVILYFQFIIGMKNLTTIRISLNSQTEMDY